MKISIATSMHPFSHKPGTVCVLPLTGWRVRVFPCLLQLDHLVENLQEEIHLDIKGPVKEFTVQQDIDKKCIFVFGQSVDGYFRYKLMKEESFIVLSMEKTPVNGIYIEDKEGSRVHLKSKDRFVFSTSVQEHIEIKSLEKLSFGSSKSQEFPSIRNRCNPAEYFPLWFSLGQTIPRFSYPAHEGAFSLLHECKELSFSQKKIEVQEAFYKLFLAGFSGILCPRVYDDEHQGIVPSFGHVNNLNPLPLLQEGAAVIRSLFFIEKEDSWSFLPCLPPSLHAGRMVQVKTKDGHEIDFEWSKKQLKKVVIRISVTQKKKFIFQPSLRTFRIRKSLKQKGKTMAVSEPISLVAGDVLFLDRFQR